jgi:hypothetical protein
MQAGAQLVSQPPTPTDKALASDGIVTHEGGRSATDDLGKFQVKPWTCPIQPAFFESGNGLPQRREAVPIPPARRTVSFFSGSLARPQTYERPLPDARGTQIRATSDLTSRLNLGYKCPTTS